MSSNRLTRSAFGWLGSISSAFSTNFSMWYLSSSSASLSCQSALFAADFDDLSLVSMAILCSSSFWKLPSINCMCTRFFRSTYPVFSSTSRDAMVVNPISCTVLPRCSALPSRFGIPTLTKKESMSTIVSDSLISLQLPWLCSTSACSELRWWCRLSLMRDSLRQGLQLRSGNRRFARWEHLAQLHTIENDGVRSLRGHGMAPTLDITVAKDKPLINRLK